MSATPSGDESIYDLDAYRIADSFTRPVPDRDKTQYASEPGDSIQCVCCGKTYVRGFYNYYNLCNDCYSQYVRQNNGELGSEPNILNWLALKRCTHKSLIL